MGTDFISAIASGGVKTNTPRRIQGVDDDNDTRQLSVDVLVKAGYYIE